MLEILQSPLGVAGVGALFSVLLLRLDRKFDQWTIDRKTEETERRERELHMKEQIEALKASIRSMQEAEQERYAREQERLAQMMLSSEALTAILRDRIIQSCRFFVSKGSVPAFERESIERMYTAYHALGGNGIASDIYNKMTRLPLEN